MAPAASAAPSQALDTYKLQLPTGTNGNVDEVTRDQLVAGYSSAYFKPTADGLGYVFTTPVNGVHTSGSTFPRTELREVNPDGSNAGWKVSDGVTRTFQGVYKVTHLPAGDRETTLFQIHNGDTEVTTVRLDDNGSAMNVVVRKNGSILAPNLLSNYAYGTSFKIKVVVNTRVKISINDTQVFDYAFSGLTVGPTGTFYLKAGNYLQANPTTASSTDNGVVELRLPTGVTHFLTRSTGTTPPPAGVPAAPVLTASSPASPNQVALDWNDVAGATSYDIHEDLHTTPDHVVANVTTSNSTRTGLAGGNYRYYVVAKNASGSSLRSNKMTCTVPGGPCTSSP